MLNHKIPRHFPQALLDETIIGLKIVEDEKREVVKKFSPSEKELLRDFDKRQFMKLKRKYEKIVEKGLNQEIRQSSFDKGR